MTTRDKKILALGVMFGLCVAGGAYEVARVLDPEHGHAQTQTGETASDQRVAVESDRASTPEAPLSSVQLTEQEQALVGIQTVEVRHRDLRHSLLASARVMQPETQLASITARIAGRIDKLYVDFTGQSVRRGQAVAEIYSPDLFSTAQEYRLALASRSQLGHTAPAEATQGADDLIAASRRRLELWGVPSQQVDQLANSPEPQLDLLIYADASGVVTERKVTQGQYVNAGDVLFTVADLSSVWIEADVYQPDLALLRAHSVVEITSDALPGQTLTGKVDLIEPQVSPQTRTVPVHIHVANPAMRLRPGMFVQARFAASGGASTLAVPRTAVVDTGMRKVVYVAKQGGEFEGREVQLGPAGDEYYPVLAGLREGEHVVTQGNFLIDSQTRITSGMTGLFGGSKAFEPGRAAAAQMKFTFRSDPATPKGGSSMKAYVVVSDPSGRSVTDAEVKLAVVMPAMPEMNMPEMRSEAKLTWDSSQYAGEVRIPMSGSWNVEIEAKRNGQFLGSHRARLVAR